jgi:chromosome segregation ATPase
MNQSAQVHSTEKLQELHAALARFRVQGQSALDNAAREIQRTLDTLHDLLRHWQGAVHERREDVNRARAALSHYRGLHRGEHVGGSELEAQLHTAQRLVREAEARVDKVRHWQRYLPEAIRDYEGPARQLAAFLDTDLRQALAVLEGKIASLASYLAVTPPQPHEAMPSGPTNQGADAPAIPIEPGKEST